MSYVSWSAALDQLVDGIVPTAVFAVDGHCPVSPSALLDFAGKIDAFKADVRGLSQSDFERIVPRSRETPTHFKWHLCTLADTSLRFWLHEYKPTNALSRGYTQSIHNHRYGLTSLILAGGYCHSRFDVEVFDDLSIGRLNQVMSYDLRPGDNYSLAADAFHSVTDVLDGTLSLVIQWPTQRMFSLSVEPATRKAVRHLPVEARFDTLRSVFK